MDCDVVLEVALRHESLFAPEVITGVRLVRSLHGLMKFDLRESSDAAARLRFCRMFFGIYRINICTCFRRSCPGRGPFL